jgi:hypothetical protein
MHILAWVALAGWLAPFPIAAIGYLALRLSPRLRAWLFDR